MIVKILRVGQIGTNCYLVYDENTMHGALVDPGDNGKELAEAIAKEGVTLDYVLLTHAHFDHILGVRAVT